MNLQGVQTRQRLPGSHSNAVAYACTPWRLSFTDIRLLQPKYHSTRCILDFVHTAARQPGRPCCSQVACIGADLIQSDSLEATLHAVLWQRPKVSNICNAPQLCIAAHINDDNAASSSCDCNYFICTRAGSQQHYDKQFRPNASNMIDHFRRTISIINNTHNEQGSFCLPAHTSTQQSANSSCGISPVKRL